VRSTVDLAYRDFVETEIKQDELLGELVGDQLHYYPTVTREPFPQAGRITDLIRSGQAFRDLGLDQAQFNPAEDRIMLCGSMAMIKEAAALIESHGLVEGSNAEPGDFVLERAFVG
jgi:ferredoxin--NADP+ reductase